MVLLIIWADPQRLGIVINRFSELAFPNEQESQVVVGIGIIRINPEGFVKMEDGVPKFVLPSQRNA